MKHFQVHFQPDGKTVTIHQGATLLEAAGLADIILSTPCGAVGRCGRCKVRLQPSGKDVLACQHTIEHDMEVFVPNTSRFFRQQILEHGTGQTVLPEAAVNKLFIDQSCSSLEQLAGIILENHKLNCGIGTHLKKQNPVIHDDPKGVTAVLTASPDADSKEVRWTLTDIENGDTTDRLYGLSVDIGTTTVVAQLVNLKTADIAATVSAANPQSRFGSDVISRISYAETHAGLEVLHNTVIAGLNDLCKEAAQKAGISRTHIYEAVMAGNTTMNHLLLKYPTHQLGQAPYQAYSVEPAYEKAAGLGLHINPLAAVYTPPNIAGFVGSDTVAAALACGMDATEIPSLLVDIGTNGEIVLGTKDRLLAASCAAGPALEGAGILHGSRAQAGAIERVLLTQDDIDVDVIGQTVPASICGSGLIDAVAVLLELEIIDTTGRFVETDEQAALFIPEKIKKRVIQHENQPAFILAGSDASGEAVILTQKDVRQIQLAKAAIQAGILFLLKKSGNAANQIQQVFLAGAFGNYIQKQNALRLGLLPNIPLEKIHFVGNAAGSGALMMLINTPIRQKARQLAKRIEYIEIAHQSEFQEVFADCLLFPEM